MLSLPVSSPAGRKHVAATTHAVDLDEAVVRRFIEASWNGCFERIEDVVSPDYVGYSSDRPEGIHGPHELEEYVSAVRSAFPDIELTIGVVPTAGDTVWASWRGTGTNDGPFTDSTPTGERTTLNGSTIVRITDGNIRESRSTLFRTG